eukprot:scpid80620/ scgid5366/ 
MVDSQTTDFKLESLMQSRTDEMHQCTSPEESALLATARFVCLAFLENRSLLLATAADFFTSSLPSINCNNRWLLSSLISKLGAHLSHGSYGTSKKRGTLLYRTGCDTVLCLYNSLAVARSETPFQLVLSDFVDAHSNSSELMRVLARVGATAGVDSYTHPSHSWMMTFSLIGPLDLQ